MGAEEAVARGLASRVVPAAELLDDALATAATIGTMSQPIVAIAKTCVNVGCEPSNPSASPTPSTHSPAPPGAEAGRLRVLPGRGAPPRAAALLLDLRDARPEDRHEGLRREGRARLRARVSARGSGGI